MKKSFLLAACLFFFCGISMFCNDTADYPEDSEYLSRLFVLNDEQACVLASEKISYQLSGDGKYTASYQYTLKQSAGRKKIPCGFCILGWTAINKAMEQLEIRVNGQKISYTTAPVPLQEPDVLYRQMIFFNVELPDTGEAEITACFSSSIAASEYGSYIRYWQCTEVNNSYVNPQVDPGYTCTVTFTSRTSDHFWLQNIISSWGIEATFSLYNNLYRGFCASGIFSFEKISADSFRLVFPLAGYKELHTMKFTICLGKGGMFGGMASLLSIGQDSENDFKSGFVSYDPECPDNPEKYIPVESNISSRLLRPEELLPLTSAQLRYLRNAFYAARGYAFKSEDLKDFFAGRCIGTNDPFGEYVVNSKFTESLFTDIEKKNVSLIRAAEEKYR
jgi:hypothetical protein